MKIERGTHTFSLTAPCSYHTIQELRETQSHYVRKMSGARLTKIISLNKYKPQGVEILLTQSIDHRSWIRLIINPSSLCSGRYEPLALFQSESVLQIVRRGESTAGYLSEVRAVTSL